MYNEVKHSHSLSQKQATVGARQHKTMDVRFSLMAVMVAFLLLLSPYQNNKLLAHKIIYVHLKKEINFLNIPEGLCAKKLFLCAQKSGPRRNGRKLRSASPHMFCMQ